MKKRILWCILCACLVSTSLFAQRACALDAGVHDTEACRKWVGRADGENDAETESGSVVHLYSPAGDKSIQQECFAKDGR